MLQLGNAARFPAGYTPAYRPGVKDTSVAALDKNAVKLSNMCERIMNHMATAYSGRTRAELAADLKISTSTMSGRVNELLRRGLLIEDGKMECSETGNTVRRLRKAA
jgi:predicted transcriptional regulator